jgi:hypothetical protein
MVYKDGVSNVRTWGFIKEICEALIWETTILGLLKRK